jgi:hypothetical protein
VAVGDFNGDGKLDVAVADDSFFGAAAVLLGNGDGTFQAARSFPAGYSPQSLAVGDFNGDGKPDLAVANMGAFGINSVSVFLNNGGGSFQPARNVGVEPNSSSAVAGDFNGDGLADLAVVNTGDGTVSVLLSNGDGSFRNAPTLALGNYAFAGAVGDFNGDGKADLAVAGTSRGVSVLLGDGDGSFQSAQYFPPAGAAVAVGDFNGDGKLDLAVAGTSPGVSVLLNQAVTTTTVSGPTSSTYGQTVTLTASVAGDAGPVTAGSVTFLDGGVPLSPALPLDGNGQASFSIATLNAGNHAITASYSGTPGGAGFAGFGASVGGLGLTVNPAPLSASAVNFQAVAGAPWSGAVATFTNADPFGDDSSYTAVIDWGDGSASVGAISESGALTVSGSHTYADPGSYSLSVQISHNLGNTTTATVYPTALATTLGQGVQDGLTGGVGFWRNKNGQALINAFNGGPDSMALSNWLVASFPNLYGALCSNDLRGFNNAQVASRYQGLFALPGSKLDAEVLATALNVYATTQSLGGAIGQTYGFTVTATGLGADSFDVGGDGAAFGVANNSTRNIYELLRAVDQQAVFGFLYNGDTNLRQEANALFNALNQAGTLG